jgi:predicted RNA binding protein YcfA (HicA-like mRNA interferase family)
MSKTPSLTSKDVIKLLEKHGFELNRINGSHHYFVHPVSKK